MTRGGWTQQNMREVVAEERLEQGVGDRGSLNPYALAAANGVDIYAIDEFPDEHCSHAAVEHFTSTRQAAWSAAPIPIGSARIILENVSHDPCRRRSSIAHELGHCLLEHDFDDVILTDDGCRKFNPVHEKQAKYFSGELLVPEAAARARRRCRARPTGLVRARLRAENTADRDRRPHRRDGRLTLRRCFGLVVRVDRCRVGCIAVVAICHMVSLCHGRRPRRLCCLRPRIGRGRGGKRRVQAD